MNNKEKNRRGRLCYRENTLPKQVVDFDVISFRRFETFGRFAISKNKSVLLQLNKPSHPITKTDKINSHRQPRNSNFEDPSLALPACGKGLGGVILFIILNDLNNTLHKQGCCDAQTRMFVLLQPLSFP